MNSIERVFTAVSGGIPDRVPVSLTASLYGASLMQCPIEDYFRKPQLYAEGQIIVASKCNTDIIFSPFVLPLFAEACGATLAFTRNSAPNVKEFIEYRPGDEIKFKTEDLINHPSSRFILEALKLIAENLGKEKVIAAINISPCDLPAMIFGIEKWLHTLLFYPQQALDIIQNLGEYFKAMSIRMYKLGAHLMVFPVNFTNPRIVTTKISGYIIPVIASLLSSIDGAKVIHHGGPDFGEAVSAYEPLSGVVGLVISPCDSIKKIRPFTAEKTIIGNIDGPIIAKHNPESIFKKCLHILEENDRNTRFILGTSNADFSYDTPLENVLALSRAAEYFSTT